MGSVRVVFLGTGDAFSAGGNHQAAYLVQSPAITFLLDCGATALASLKRASIPSGPIDTILVSHLHGDHFAGLPFFFLEYAHIEPRRRPLHIAGPIQTRERVTSLCEAMYPGALRELPFELDFIEMQPDQRLQVGPLAVDPFCVPHQEGQVSLGLNLEVAGKKITYSGDAGWTEELISRSMNADLFICESSFYETRIPSHLDYLRLIENRGRLSSKRLVLTHLGNEVHAHRSEIDMELAYDGLIVDL